MSILFSKKTTLITHEILQINYLIYSFSNRFFIYNRHFLPFRRTDLTASASLQPGWVGTVRGSSLQLHGPLLRSCSNLGSLIIQEQV
jgi:hypothetical protein